MLLKKIVTTFCLVIAASVVLSVSHAKDIFALQTPVVGIQHADDQQANKVVGDLHVHVDKQVVKVSQDLPQLDNRSLRLRDYKRIQLSSLRNWLQAWRNQLGFLIG